MYSREEAKRIKENIVKNKKIHAKGSVDYINNEIVVEWWYYDLATAAEHRAEMIKKGWVLDEDTTNRAKLYEASFFEPADTSITTWRSVYYRETVIRIK